MKRFFRLTALICSVLMMTVPLSSCSESVNGGKTDGTSLSEDKDGSDSADKDNDNNKDNNKKESDVIFSAEGGFFAEPFELELSPARSGLKIYYTTDGSEPDESSTLYTEPIKLENRTSEPNALSAHTDISVSAYGAVQKPLNLVKKANIIRAAAYDDGKRVGDIVTQTYFVGLDREKLYGGVPVISLVTPEDGLFGYENGIYVLGKAHDDFLAADPKNAFVEPWHQESNFTQRGKEWERVTSLEYFDTDGGGFSQTMGLRIMGAASRNETQKSFRLTAREEYGKKNVKYEMIPGNRRSDKTGAVEKYKSFVLRNGGNDCWGTRFRDPLIQSLVADRAFDTLQSRPVTVFLNGEYWGLYTLTEDYSDNYIENNYGIDSKNVVIIKRGELEEGEEGDEALFTEMYDYIMNNDMSDDSNYAKASEMLDMQGFADICAMHVYINNEDGIFQNNNYRFWRVRTPDGTCGQSDGKWRILAYDTEYSTGVYDGGQSADFDTVSMAVNGSGKIDKELPEPPYKMFVKLLDNQSFKDMFIMSLCDMRNICFEKNHAVAEMKKFAEIYRPLSKDSCERYGHDPGEFEWSLGGLEYFLNARYDRFMNMITKSFGDRELKKAEVMILKTDGGKILVNGTSAAPSADIKASYFTNYPLRFTAVPDDGKKFVEWRHMGNCTLSDESSADITVDFTSDFSITAVFE
ncbi:MAG: CotH kinase family protein [Ruminococcus sp.]|nr:CotH kinase family protein [Ruminococcus sp.]